MVRHKGFPGGAILPNDKDLTEGLAIQDIPLPSTVQVALDDGAGGIYPADFIDVFAEDRLIEAGLPGVRSMVDHAVEVVVPELAAMDPEPLTDEDAEPLDRYMHVVDLLQQMITNDEERAMLEALRNRSEPELRRLADDVLGIGNR